VMAVDKVYRVQQVDMAVVDISTIIILPMVAKLNL
jgi:hypothetical protein